MKTIANFKCDSEQTGIEVVSITLLHYEYESKPYCVVTCFADGRQSKFDWFHYKKSALNLFFGLVRIYTEIEL